MKVISEETPEKTISADKVRIEHYIIAEIQGTKWRVLRINNIWKCAIARDSELVVSSFCGGDQLEPYLRHLTTLGEVYAFKTREEARDFRYPKL